MCVFCLGGPLVDILRERNEPLSLELVVQVLYQTCQAVRHMHSQTPPIIHRDLKVTLRFFSTRGAQ